MTDLARVWSAVYEVAIHSFRTPGRVARPWRRILLVLTAGVVCFAFSASAQSRVPAPQQALIIVARSFQQASPQSPYELRLASGTRIVVPFEDVHQPATTLVRAEISRQATPPVDPALVFVLHIKTLMSAGKTLVNVTLQSGGVVRVATNDIGDPRLTFLRTVLAEAFAFERANEYRAGLSAQFEYMKTVDQKIREHWQPSQDVAGKVTMKFVVQRDGRVTDIEVKESGGEVLDLASMRALMVTGRLPPLPKEIQGNTLTMQLVFEYVR